VGVCFTDLTQWHEGKSMLILKGQDQWTTDLAVNSRHCIHAVEQIARTQWQNTRMTTTQ